MSINESNLLAFIGQPFSQLSKLGIRIGITISILMFTIPQLLDLPNLYKGISFAVGYLLLIALLQINYSKKAIIGLLLMTIMALAIFTSIVYFNT